MLVAPLWHSLGLLVFLLCFSLGFFRMQSANLVATKGGKYPHGNVTLYLAIIVAEWALCFYIWLGSRCRGAVPMRDLIGGHWRDMKAVLLDVVVAAVFWLVWSAVAFGIGFLVRPAQTEPTAFLSPMGAVEITLWVTMSMTAGFCEELVYRGYLQRQALALTGSVAFGVLVQAALFGVGHWYQGGKKVLIITVLGVLFGLLAHWRKSLRPGMISHAWEDVLNVIPIHFP